MADIRIYSKALCPYCLRAKSLLRKKGVPYNEIDVTFSGERRAEMIERSGGRHTVPQIFLGERHIGGCDELLALDRSGELDALIGT